MVDHNNFLDVKALFILAGAFLINHFPTVDEFFKIAAWGTAIVYNVIQASIAIKKYKDSKRNK